MNSLIIYQMIFTTLPLSFAVIHLILFFFFRKSKANLYFGLFLLFYSASIFFDYQTSIYSETRQAFVYLRIHRAIQPFYLVFSLRFVYSLFYTRLLKRFRYMVLIIFCFGIFAVIYPHQETGYRYFSIASIPFTLEIFRVIGYAIYKKKYGSLLIGSGYLIYYFFSSFDMLMDMGVQVPFMEMENPYAIGTIGFLITMTIHLAKRYSDTSNRMIENERILKENEISRRLLEAESDRKSKELAEARDLQLSMLPKCLDNFPGIDVCFFMEPATEVGGDFYDYLTTDDGSIIIAVGDATGHGLKSGIMVSSIKSIFQSSGADPDIPSFFNRSTEIIKRMNMKNLFMALAVVRIKGTKMTASSAGMPYILIHRANLEKVEILKLKGPPIGSFSGFSYKTMESSLNSGDTVMIMSDGFQEQFNNEGEMMGLDRTVEVFRNSISGSADDVVSKFIQSAVKWRGSNPQDDDMTFVVIKKK